MAKLHNIDFRKLRYFTSVAELGSFTKAAQQLHIAQPALSRQVRLLEEDLGLQLMSRTRHGVSLTDAGEVLLSHAHSLAASLAQVVEDMQTRAGAPKGDVVVGLPPSTASTLAPPLVERVSRDFPMVSLRITEGVSFVLANWVETGTVDLAVLSYPVDSRALRLEPIALEEIVIVEKTTSPAPPVYSLGMLSSKPLILADAFETIARNALGLPSLSLNVRFHIDAVEAIRTMVLSGFGATMLPVSLFQRELAEGIVSGSAITSQGVRRTLMLATPALRQSTRAIDAVSNALKEEVSHLERTGVFTLQPPPVRRAARRKKESRGKDSG